MNHEALKNMTIKERSKYLWSTYTTAHKALVVFGAIVIAAGGTIGIYDKFIDRNIIGAWVCDDSINPLMSLQFSSNRFFQMGTVDDSNEYIRGTYTLSGNELDLTWVTEVRNHQLHFELSNVSNNTLTLTGINKQSGASKTWACRK